MIKFCSFKRRRLYSWGRKKEGKKEGSRERRKETRNEARMEARKNEEETKINK